MKKIALGLALMLTGCGSTLGRSCKSDTDCSAGLTCLSPACLSDGLECQYACHTDSDCTNADFPHCETSDPYSSCVGFCNSGR